MRATRIAITLVAIIFVVAFAAFVWPTLYRPILIRAPLAELPSIAAARQNRFTGEVEWLRAASYRFAGAADSAASLARERDDSGDELHRLALEARLSDKRRRIARWFAEALALAVGLALVAFSIIRVRRSRYHAT